MQEFRSFIQGLVGKLTTAHDLSDFKVSIEPVEKKKTQIVTITFEFAQPRTGHADAGAGGFIRGCLEPGFFRRRRIKKLLTYTVRYEMRRYKFFNSRGDHGIISERAYRHCSHTIDSTWFKVTLYFESPTGITSEYPLFPQQVTYTAKDFDVNIPSPEVVWA